MRHYAHVALLYLSTTMQVMGHYLPYLGDIKAMGDGKKTLYLLRPTQGNYRSRLFMINGLCATYDQLGRDQGNEGSTREVFVVRSKRHNGRQLRHRPIVFLSQIGYQRS